MPVFIELVTEPAFSFATQRYNESSRSRRAGLSSVRRPLRGLEIKEDTYAVFRVIRSDGTEIPLVDSGSATGESNFFSNFMLQSVQEARMEKHQILETFGETFVFFFGEMPRFLECSAIVVDSHNFNWKAEFLANYERYLRGTKLAELGACAYLFYNDNVVTGYLLQCDALDVADRPMEVQLRFRMMLVNYNNVSFVGDPNFPIRASVVIPDVLAGDGPNAPLRSALGGEALNALIAEGVGIRGESIGGQWVANGVIEQQGPLRSLIAHNQDEWTGEAPTLGSDYTQSPYVSTTQQVRDLNMAVTAALIQLGVNPDCAESPDSMFELSLGPSFFGAGVGVGFGSSGGAGATFGAGFGTRSGATFGTGFGLSGIGGGPSDPGAGLFGGAGASASLFGGARAGAGAGARVGGSTSGGAGASAGLSAGASFGIGASAGIGVGASVSGSSSNGASIDVAGVASAFASSVCSGTLDLSGVAGLAPYITNKGPIDSYAETFFGDALRRPGQQRQRALDLVNQRFRGF